MGMSIQAIWEKLKGVAVREDVRLSVLVFAVAISAFALGRISVEPNSTTQTSYNQAEVTSATLGSMAVKSSAIEGEISREEVVPGAVEGGYVASKSGTKYHLPWCSGAKRIKEENKIWFKTKSEAEAAGYEPAANCKGI